MLAEKIFTRQRPQRRSGYRRRSCPDVVQRLVTGEHLIRSAHERLERPRAPRPRGRSSCSPRAARPGAPGPAWSNLTVSAAGRSKEPRRTSAPDACERLVGARTAWPDSRRLQRAAVGSESSTTVRAVDVDPDLHPDSATKTQAGPRTPSMSGRSSRIEQNDIGIARGRLIDRACRRSRRAPRWLLFRSGRGAAADPLGSSSTTGFALVTVVVPATSRTRSDPPSRCTGTRGLRRSSVRSSALPCIKTPTRKERTVALQRKRTIRILIGGAAALLVHSGASAAMATGGDDDASEQHDHRLGALGTHQGRRPWPRPRGRHVTETEVGGMEESMYEVEVDP